MHAKLANMNNYESLVSFSFI